MKKVIAITTLSLLCSGAFAATNPTEKNRYTEAKQGATFFTAAITGGIAGGPLGFVIGAIGGAYMGEQIKQADEATVMTSNLKTANLEIGELKQQLNEQQQVTESLEHLVFQSVSLPVLFHTNSDQLNEQGRQHVHSLASFLRENPTYHVNLTGHTDPRGTDEYNNVLSQYRAEAVKAALEISGINADRIRVSGYGATYSTAKQGDVEGYAKERRVDIELTEDSGLVMN